MPTVYLWEIIHTVPGQEEPYMTSVLANSVQGRFLGANADPADPSPFQVGLFRTAEVSGLWPKVINLWAAREWERMVGNFKMQFGGGHADLEEWWNRNLTLRRGGFDRVLLPVAFSPSPARLAEDDMKGRVFLHEIAKVPWGQVPAYLERLEKEFLPAARRHGWQLIGAYTVAFRPREVLTVWGMSEWRQLAALRAAGESEPDLQFWFAFRDQAVTCSEELVLIPGRINPLHPNA
jgi:hypothetical protein